MTESSGASVDFPAGAIAEDTTFRISKDSTGAPPVPESLTTAGGVYAITPHGGHFAKPVEVSIPVPATALLKTQEYKLAKAEPNGEWQILGDSKVVDGKLKATVNSFSYFAPVIITYTLPIAQAVPYHFTVSITCRQQDCQQLVGPEFVTISITSNGGQLPAPCTDGRLTLNDDFIWGGTRTGTQLDGNIPVSGITKVLVVPPAEAGWHAYSVAFYCSPSPGYFVRQSLDTYEIHWQGVPTYPSLSMVRMPAQLDVLEGREAFIEAMLSGGAVQQSPSRVPTSTDHAVVNWMRSDNGGASWQTVGQSFQHEGNPLPFGGVGMPWAPWSIRYVFTATAADQGALIRINACYTPPAPTAAPPCVTSAVTQLNVLQASASPAIVIQPRSVLIRSAETANFTVTASGQPAPSLQWQSRPANSVGEWTDVSAGSGADMANYTTAPRSLSDNGEQYRVVATSMLGSAASAPVTVSVSDLTVAPSITTQPASLAVTAGNDAVFAVAAYGTEALSYQWRYKGADVQGANSPVLRLTGVTAADAGSYSVIVSNSAGSATSDGATLTITAGAPVAVAPSIVTQPASVTVNSGNTATFAVGVDGTGPFTFQWRRDGVNIAGANSASLTFRSAALPNEGVYSVQVTNSAGSIVSGTVSLTVLPGIESLPPSITSQPSTVIVPSGGSAMLAVGATGSGPLSYQWSFNGAAIPGATLPVLSLTNVGNANVGSYTVAIANDISSTSSQAAQLILLGAPVITQDPVATTAAEGATATFNVAADGSGLHYQWLLNGTQIPGATDASYTTPMLVGANSGAVYGVMVYNGAGLVTSQGAALTVQVGIRPSVAQQPGNVTVQAGQPAEICVAFGGTAPFDVEFVRLVDGGQWAPVGPHRMMDNTESCFSTPNLQAVDNGAQFRFFATNEVGAVMTDVATVTVESPTTITTTTLVSALPDGRVPGYGSYQPSVSADGRFVAFTSLATDLIPGPTLNQTESGNAFLRDLTTGTTTLINRAANGAPSERGVINLKLSSNGRYALFTSLGSDLVANDTNGSMDVFRRDLLTGTTVRVNVLDNGVEAPGTGNGTGDLRLSISGDGRFVTFISSLDVSSGGNGGDNGNYYLYLRDMQTGITRKIDGNNTETVAYVAVSDDGHYVAYSMGVPAPSPQPIMIYDVEEAGAYEIFSIDQTVSPAGLREGMSISGDGHYVVFAASDEAVTGTWQGQILLVDRTNPGVAKLVSTGPSGAGDGTSANPRISADGRYVVFETNAPNLTSGVAQASSRWPVIRDVVGKTTGFAAHALNGNPVWEYTGSHAISADGKTIAFVSDNSVMTGGFNSYQVYAEPRR